MKILVITAFYPPHHGGGFGLRCADVVNGLRVKGHAVHVLTNRCLVAGCNVHENDGFTLRELDLRPEGENPLQQIIFDRRTEKIAAGHRPCAAGTHLPVASAEPF